MMSDNGRYQGSAPLYGVPPARSDLGVLVLAFAVYATFEGVTALFAAIRGWSYRRDRWLLLLEAVAGIGVGILALHSQGMTAYVLILLLRSGL